MAESRAEKQRKKVAAVASFEDGALSSLKYEEPLFGSNFTPYAVVVLGRGECRTPTASGYVPQAGEAKAWVYSEQGLAEDGLTLPKVPLFSFSGAFQLAEGGKLAPMRRKGIGLFGRSYSADSLSGAESRYLPGLF